MFGAVCGAAVPVVLALGAADGWADDAVAVGRGCEVAVAVGRGRAALFGAGAADPVVRV